jgi:magnesium-transporting ATPase (P-type)
MNRTMSYCALIVAMAVVIVISVAKPELLGKQNLFLENFVNHELINTMCVLATITLASTSQIHLAFNAIEERHKKRGLEQSRAGVRQAAYALIFLLAASIVLVTVKPLVGNGDSVVAFCNGLCLFLLLWSILILLSITRLVFAIKADI